MAETKQRDTVSPKLSYEGWTLAQYRNNVYCGHQLKVKKEQLRLITAQPEGGKNVCVLRFNANPSNSCRDISQNHECHGTGDHHES